MIILGFQGGVTGVVFIDGAQSSRLILLQEGRRGARANIESDIDNTLQGGGHRPAFRVSKVFFITLFIFLIEDQQKLKKEKNRQCICVKRSFGEIEMKQFTFTATKCIFDVVSFARVPGQYGITFKLFYFVMFQSIDGANRTN